MEIQTGQIPERINFKQMKLPAIETMEKLHQVMEEWKLPRIIQAAVKLRLFDHMKAPASIEIIAENSKTSLRGTGILIDALCACGLVKRHENQYVNSPLAQENLVSDAVSMLPYSIDHGEQMFRRWGNLPEAARLGIPPENSSPASSRHDPESNRVFIKAMHAIGFARAKYLMSLIPLDGIRNVLDVGGGAGSYLIALAQRLPSINAVLIDRSPTLQVAAQILTEYGMRDKVTLVENDIFMGEDGFGGPFDFAILSSILHMEGPKENERLIRRIKKSLIEGGRLLINEFFLDESALNPHQAVVFSANMLSGTPRGRSYRISEVHQWLADAGFKTIEPLTSELKYDTWIAS